jgi:hypothetical protein
LSLDYRIVGSTEMEHEKFTAVNQCIREAAQQAAAPGGLSAPLIERFLRTADETWDGAGSGRFTTAQFQNNEAYRRAAKHALRTVFHMLANLLPAEAQLAPRVDPEAIRSRVAPMVTGLVQEDWQEVATRELVSRTFVLNFRGAKAALEVELPSCDMESAWRILWALYGDYGLRPDHIEMTCDGLAGDYAHVRWFAYETKDPYSDVVVHEAAHLLHYLKPRNFGLHVRRHQERFVDIDFNQRELFAYACEAYSRLVLHGPRKARVSFAEKMQDEAFSFPRGEIKEVAALVMDAARARNGWRVIWEATVIRRARKRAKAVTSQPLELDKLVSKRTIPARSYST